MKAASDRGDHIRISEFAPNMFLPRGMATAMDKMIELMIDSLTGRWLIQCRQPSSCGELPEDAT